MLYLTLLCPWLRHRETCCRGMISSSRVLPRFLLGSGDLIFGARCLQVFSICLSPKRIYRRVWTTVSLPQGSPILCWRAIAVVPPAFAPVESCALCWMVWYGGRSVLRAAPGTLRQIFGRGTKILSFRRPTAFAIGDGAPRDSGWGLG
jgi:hypothetical protein